MAGSMPLSSYALARQSPVLTYCILLPGDHATDASEVPSATIVLCFHRRWQGLT